MERWVLHSNELIIVIIIFGAIGAVAIPKYLNLSAQNSLNEARLVCGHLRDSIDYLHTDYLIDGTDYDVNEVIGKTLLAGGVNLTNNLNTLTYVSKSRNYTWTYIPRNDIWPAYLTETAVLHSRNFCYIITEMKFYYPS